MTRIAFLSMDDLSGFVSYDSLAMDILRERGFTVEEVSWRKPSVNWRQFDLVVQRTSWDYQHSPDDYLTVLAAIEHSQTRLENSLAIARWNIRKTYLRDLQAFGVTIVPTEWVESPSMDDFQRLFHELGSREIVIKPVVGANADNAFWLRLDNQQSIWRDAARAFKGQPGLVQPFVTSVTTFGEISLIFFLGEYSHSVLKTPKSGDFRVQEEHGGSIVPYIPEASLVEFARRSLQGVPEPVLYARVDIVLLASGNPAIMEVELIEPSLYLSFDSEAPRRFANAIETRCSDKSNP